jgi:hypothetical protein
MVEFPKPNQHRWRVKMTRPVKGTQNPLDHASGAEERGERRGNRIQGQLKSRKRKCGPHSPTRFCVFPALAFSP